MIPAVFTRTYPFKTARDVFEAARADGYRAVQLNLSSLGLKPLPEAVPASLPEAARAVADEEGVAICALSGTYNMAHPDAGARRAARERFARVVEAAGRLGAPMVSLCTGSRNTDDMWSAHPDNASPQAWTDLRAELDAALALAEAADLTLGIEPEPGNVVRDARAAPRILDEVGSPRLRIILDAANLIGHDGVPRQADIMVEAFDLLGPAITSAHAKDIDATGTVVPPGTGVIDLSRFVRGLRSADYNGALIGHGFAHADTARAAVALQALCEEVT